MISQKVVQKLGGICTHRKNDFSKSPKKLKYMVWFIKRGSNKGYFIWQSDNKMLVKPVVSKQIVVCKSKKISYTFEGVNITIEKSNNDEAMTQIFAEITANFISKPSP